MNAAELFVQPAQIVRTQGTELNEQTKLIAIIRHLQYEFRDYKYTVYRTASKFVRLQKVFHTAQIPYKLVLAVLERHGIRDVEPNFMVPPFQLTSIIHDVYFACENLGHFTKSAAFQLEAATAVLANFFWNIFDPHRRHSISLLEIKVTFLLLCKLCASDQLVTEFFNLVGDTKSKCVSKYCFEYLLNILIKTLTYIGEGNAYGVHNSQMVMDQCFTRCHNTTGLTEYQFHCIWSTTQTRFLIFANLVALIKRIEDTEKLIHNNICASCRCEKIIGIRFKCQNCQDLSLCLKCFATGFATNRHEAGHRMYEVFTEDVPPKKFTHYFAKLCNIFCTPQVNSEEETTGFCNANETTNVANNTTELVTIVTNHSSSAASTVSVTVAASAVAAGLSTTAMNASNASGRLQSIIDRLLQQNTKLENQLKHVKTASHEQISEFLSAHQQFLVEIINEMRNFSQLSIGSYPTSSTPNRSIYANKVTNQDDLNAATSNLTHSINGADINRSYLDANKSDYSLNDLSLWFNQRRLSTVTAATIAKPLRMLPEATLEIDESQDAAGIAVSMRETEMTNFKLLLHKVKEIVDDSYSDNTELAAATQNLENVLDNIIKSEESRRTSIS